MESATDGKSLEKPPLTSKSADGSFRSFSRRSRGTASVEEKVRRRRQIQERTEKLNNWSENERKIQQQLTEPATNRISHEKRLKLAALAWACTLTPPTGFPNDQHEPPSDDESLEDKVRRKRREALSYKWDENEGN
ncbi:hypothetical protein ACROYT_G029735 [Oculina patagonica]